MKKVVAIMMVWMLGITIAPAKNRAAKSSLLEIIAVKSHAVYFKVDVSFVGGSVEVYDENRNLLHAECLPQTHSMVLFNEKPSGKYFIKVKKGSKTIEFGYIHI